MNEANRDAIAQQITSNTEAGMPNVVFIVGHATIPYAGYLAHDGHTDPPDDCHGGPWVCDGYYGSLSSNWEDADSRTGCEWAIPNDGCFDAFTLPGQNAAWYLPPLEMAVGRVDFSDLDALLGADFLADDWNDTAEQVEFELTRQYILKAHRYRMGQMTFGERVCVMSKFGGTAGLKGAADLAYPLFGWEYGKLFTAEAYAQRTPCAFAVYYNYGRPNQHQRPDGTWFNMDKLKYRDNHPTVLFYNLWGSWFPDWNWGWHNDFLPALLATEDYGLACLAGYRWALHKLAVGETLADVMVRSPQLFSFQSILGDPTLRMRWLAPVRGLRAERVGNTVHLDWNPAPETGTVYYVYRSTEGADLLDGFGDPLPPGETAETTWTDSSVPAFPVLYQVRSSRLVTTAAGSYRDLSQGVFVEVQ